jgi:DNA-binding NarL/FixJ family response regulator
LDFTDRLKDYEPNRRMVASWLASSGMRLSFVIAMKTHLGLVAVMRSIVVQSRIKGVVTTEEEALQRVFQSNAGMLICTDQLKDGDGFSLTRRAIKLIPDLKVVMIMTSPHPNVSLALASGATGVVCEEDLLAPEMEVMQALLGAANGRKHVSNLARMSLNTPEIITEAQLSLTPREKEILQLLLNGRSDKEISTQLGISIETVKDYGKSIRIKYNVKTRFELIGVVLGRSLKRVFQE